MIAFLLILIFVFLLVDALVLAVIEPLAYSSRGTKSADGEKMARRESELLELGLVGATMYDGGEKDKEGSKKENSDKK